MDLFKLSYIYLSVSVLYLALTELDVYKVEL